MSPSAGVTVWLTGLPSAGKTTVARAAAAELAARGTDVEVLDGDEVRPVLSTELGYSRADRDLNVGRIGWVAQRLATHGVTVLAAVVSPYAEARDGVRRIHDEAGLGFLEVHVATPAEVCAERDVKGLYAKQRGGGMSGLTGADGGYEPPAHPELVLQTAGDVDTAVKELLDTLDRLHPSQTASHDREENPA